MSNTRVLGLAALCLFAAAPVFAQQYPVKSIRFIVGFPPDGYTIMLNGPK